MNRKVWKSAGIISVVTVMAFLLVTTIYPNMLNKLFAEEKIGADRPPVTLNEHVKAINDAYVKASHAVVPTVVSIKVTIKNKPDAAHYHDDFQDFFKFFGQQPYESDPEPMEAAGSGVFITPDGYIMTNNHVVENATDIKVTTDDQKEYKAKLIGTDPSTDLAVIKIEGENFPYVHLGDIDNVKVGEMVIAVGNPLGLNSTVTAGIVSAIGRGSLALNRDKNGYGVENFIQTDAAINPGNSGGGLFNLEGSLIGINTAIATKTGTYIGYGFAIPVDIVKAVISDIIKNGKVSRGFIGVQIRTIDEVVAKSLGLDKVEGAVVNDVVKGSPAEKAKIEPGDVILEIDGKPLKSSNELQAQVVKKKPGDIVDLKIWRDNKKIDVKVKLEAKDVNNDEASNDAEAGESDDNGSTKSTTFDKLGFTVESLNSKDKEAFKVDYGVKITKVERSSPLLQRGLIPDGVITKADRTPIKSIKDLKKIINDKKSGDPLLLQVKYKDSNRIIAVEMP